MKDLRNVFVLFIVAFVAVIAIVVMLVSPSVNYHLSNSVGFAFSSVYSGYSVPIDGVVVDSNLNFANATDVVSHSVNVSDDIIYRRAYISYDGQAWTPFNITPTSTLSGDWIYGRGISNILFSPSILHLNNSRNSSNNTFIIIYTCSKNITIHNWSCHDGWQIIPFNARLNSASSVSPTITFVSPTPVSGLTINTSSQEIAASVTDDSSVISSWIDFDKSLVGYWSMDSYSATGIYDNSSYKNFGTFTGGLSKSNIVDGVRGKALSFDGVNAYVDTGNTTGLNTLGCYNTFSLWIKPNVLYDYEMYIAKFHDDGPGLGFDFGLMSDGRAVLMYRDDVWRGDQFTTNTVFSLNTWVHLVVVQNGANNVYVYKNGNYLETLTTAPCMINPSAYALSIGNREGGYFFNGTIDEVMIFNRSLSATEVKALYDSKANKFDATFSGLSNGLHSYTVYAVDGDGNFASSSRTFSVNSTTCILSCSNKECGSDGCGGSCGTCLSTQSCTGNVCVNNVVSPTCFDGIPNQGETGVDCGGPCSACQMSTGITYYISTGGSDGASGSINSPWKTLAYACSVVKNAGDIIHVNQGTFPEYSQCNLAVGVSIEGEGTSSIIESHVTGSVYSDMFTIMLVSSSTTNGHQHISNLKMDGDALTAYGAIYVEKRSNVEISHCMIVHFFYYALGFDGGNSKSGGYFVPPVTYPTGNKVHDCIIDDCSAYYPANEPVNGEGKGAITVNGQEGMLIYNNILTQTSRAPGNNGYLIKGVAGMNKGLKIFNNTIVKAPYDGTTWDFAIELWLCRGGVEIYNNDITGSVDISGSGGELTASTQKTGSYTYGVYIHDNYIHQTNSESFEGIRGILIEQSAEDVIIERNHIKSVATGIYMPLGYAGSTLKNVYIQYNIIEDLAGPNWQTRGMLIGNPGGYTCDNININNNIFIARDTALTTMQGIEIPMVGATSNVNIKNNIVQGFDKEPVYASGSSGETLKNVVITNNIFYNNGNNNQPLFSGITASPYVYQNNQEGVNPSFVSSTNFHLNPGSPAIDKGINVGSTSDYDGNSVPYGSAPDIGAYEYR